MRIILTYDNYFLTNLSTAGQNANAFASTFYFFADTQGNAKKIKRACKPTHPTVQNFRANYYL